MITKPSRLVNAHPIASLIGVGILVAGGLLIAIGSSNNAPSSSLVTCSNNQASDTKALQTAISSTTTNGVVNIASGTCALSANLPIHRAMTVNGAGAQLTFLVQHADANIFQITAPGVTIESINLDTGTFHPGIPPVKKSPVSAVLFSASSNTTVRDVTAKAGSGFGMRITGPSPCSSFGTRGTIVQNVIVSNTGQGGFTALDIDCTNGATLSGITIDGDYLALFQDTNVTLNGLAYTPRSKGCQFAVYGTGPLINVAITNVSGGGGVKLAGTPITNVTQTQVTKAKGC